MKHEDDFEGLLNEALSDVREAEPRVGLEGRVLAGVRSASDERRVGWWKWVAVAAMVVVIVLGIAVRHGAKNDVVVKKAEDARPVESQKVPSAAVKEVRPAGSVAARVVRKKVVREPKVEVEQVAAEKALFPIPTPMTEQEKALMLLARRHSDVVEETASVDTASGKLPILKSIDIAEIKIEPLGAAETRGER
jgi:hypothetical protein